MNAPRYDLHCHSTWSDGVLSPADVVRRAAGRNVGVLALTDHDETGGVAEAREAAAAVGVRLVAGIELSVSWERNTIHVVGLALDAEAPELQAGIESIRAGRVRRARAMADALAAVGIRGAWEGAQKYVTSERLISRTHFARFLVESGYVGDVASVFRRYLVRGKPGYVPHQWASLPDAVAWIRAAGGVAVVAHPGRYPITPTAMRRLLGEFRDLGGEAIEVLSSAHTAAQAVEYATLAGSFGLLASTGTDFHAPDESWLDLGSLPDLPGDLTPVWTRF